MATTVTINILHNLRPSIVCNKISRSTKDSSQDNIDRIVREMEFMIKTGYGESVKYKIEIVTS